MTLAHLLAAALLLCSLPAFAQDQRPSHQGALSGDASFFLKSDTAAAPEEPWRIIPSQPTDVSTGNPLDRLQVDKYKVFPPNSDGHTRLLSPDADGGIFLSAFDGQPDAATTCFKIRSYVVARDSKHSDSTHPVSYSTCQPAARYHVKTTEMRSGSADR